MSVALSNGVMLLSELIIIYLAAAAPFGVANFLRQPGGAKRTRSLLQATGAALLWPLALLSRSRVPKKFGRAEHEATAAEGLRSRELRIESARRALLSSLYRAGDTAEEVCGLRTEAAHGALRETIASVERYVGLALAVADADADAEEASPRAAGETELCRLSGRVGDDLDIAALCHGRRNMARLRTHQANSRLELLHALAELREVFEITPAATTTDAHAAAPALAERPLFAALLETYARAIDLLSLFGDERAAAQVGRLLDGVRARLHRTESFVSPAAPESPVRTDAPGNISGDESCTTPIPPANPHTRLSRTQTLRAHS